MHIDGWTLLLQAINLAVLLALLRWLLYKPLMAVIDQRQHSVDATMAAAEAARQQAEQDKQALAAQHAAIDTTREQLLDGARQSAEAERQALLASAQAAAQATQDDARRQIDKERQRASQALLAEASTLAVDLARRLIESSPAPLLDADFVDALLAHLAATPAQDRQRWLGETRPAPVTLVCASAPSEAMRHKVQESLTKSLGIDIQLDSVTQPALLHGAELHFEHGVLSQSWSAELAAAQAEMLATDR